VRASRENMGKILHNTTKYDGSLHYRFRTELVWQDHHVLVLYRPPDTAMETYRGSFASDRRALFFFFRDRYHNSMVSWQRDWTPHMLYANIATPARWNRRQVNAIDLDLDVIHLARDGQIIVDDQEEFEQHIRLFNYPAELVSECRRELQTVRGAMEREEGVLSPDLYDWRPGDSGAPDLLSEAAGAPRGS
jgi:protein associated with RNAse G/E